MADDELKHLTKEELAEIRHLLESDRRVKWAWATARVFAQYIAGTVAAIYGAYHAVKDMGLFR
jgi:hypothetical protein